MAATRSERITGQWHDHKFTVSSDKIISFIDLQLKGSSETEDLIKGDEKFVKYKNAKPKEVTFTIKLNAMLGCDVRKEVQALIDESQNGAMDYLYIGKKKVMSCMLMLTEASVKEMAFTSKMKWLWADVSVTFKQSSTNDGSTDGKSTSSSSGGGGGSRGGSGGGSSRSSGGGGRSGGSGGGGSSIASLIGEAVDRVRTAVEEERQRQTTERQQSSGGGGGGKRTLMTR